MGQILKLKTKDLERLIELSKKATVYDRVIEMSGELPVQYFSTQEYVEMIEPNVIESLARFALEAKEILEIVGTITIQMGYDNYVGTTTKIKEFEQKYFE